ncbi:hypothetical protein GGTG_03072 [Gaeumannomyces tritici R3-111a-1]|uniref:Uncharacterized protein n=1 Tax=Gaeumannomyces tritici (strain R3-111a-1) TaxID=644352 RepID=J3NP66_GAET3|nr:hypothetical protein GGTG_03072 [Gaeumannomyces tritici R3-111a-1]EJT77969.1 hypothetical protein GGTG_03072 [Gaeumannomyces tritici R3-111a-1]
MHQSGWFASRATTPGSPMAATVTQFGLVQASPSEGRSGPIKRQNMPICKGKQRRDGSKANGRERTHREIRLAPDSVPSSGWPCEFVESIGRVQLRLQRIDGSKRVAKGEATSLRLMARRSGSWSALSEPSWRLSSVSRGLGAPSGAVHLLPDGTVQLDPLYPHRPACLPAGCQQLET